MRQTDDMRGARRRQLFRNPAREASLQYMARGIQVVPVNRNEKRPQEPEWQTRQFTDRDFNPWHANIAVKLGSPSGGLTDVDLDSPEAIALADWYLPPTGCEFGRASKPRSHRLYRTNCWEIAKRAANQFEDPTHSVTAEATEHGGMLVELRTGRTDKRGKIRGAVSLVPPSIHPSGEAVRWDRDEEPARVEGTELVQSVSLLAAASLLLRHYPTHGQRHEAFLVLGGFLARADWTEQQIEDLIAPVIQVAGDDEMDDRISAATSAVARLRDGDDVAGTPRMCELFGDAIVEALARWLSIEDRNADTDDSGEPKASLPPAPRSMGQVIATFERWLLLEDLHPVYALLGTIAGNLLPGDPIWLGIIAPPSSAKTEMLNATARLPFVVRAATLTQGALLSGTPKKQQARGAKGGLLRQIADFGILSLKDFGSILSMRPDARAEIMAALREIYDGQWTRQLGTDGGLTLEWSGKMGLIFGCTAVLDQHYAVIAAMGDRFLLIRMRPAPTGQFERALKHAGAATAQMRTELADAVAGLFAHPLPSPQPLSKRERKWLARIVSLLVRLRGSVVRDRYTREIEAVLGAEGPARLGLTLERLLAGLDTVGVDRATAFDVVQRVAYDSVPPLRLKAYRYLRFKCEHGGYQATTPQIATALGLPTVTVRRALEELAAYDVVRRIGRAEGKADLWVTGPWGTPPDQPAPAQRPRPSRTRRR